MDELIKRIDRIAREVDNKTLEQRGLKLSEETGEVTEAILSYLGASGCLYKNKSAIDIVEECIDVVLVALSIITDVKDISGVNELIISNMLETKLNKWEKVNK